MWEGLNPRMKITAWMQIYLQELPFLIILEILGTHARFKLFRSLLTCLALVCSMCSHKVFLLLIQFV